jgi:hypothetical protein
MALQGMDGQSDAVALGTGMDIDQVQEVWLWVKDLLVPLRVKKATDSSGDADLLPGPFNMYLMALHFLRIYPPIVFFAAKLELSNATVHDMLSAVLAAMETALAPFLQWPRQPQHLPRYTKEPAVDAVCLIDTTVMRVYRPGEEGERRRLYSPKTDPHWGYKMQIVAGLGGRIWACDGPVPASKADVTILRESGVLRYLSPRNRAIADAAYRGSPEADRLITPTVKPPGGEVSADD